MTPPPKAPANAKLPRTPRRRKARRGTSPKLVSLFWIMVVVGILVLSWIGLSQYYPESNSLRYLPDRIYRMLKIVMGSDPVLPLEPPDVPFALIVVKILVTLLLIRALFKVVQSVFLTQYSQLKAWCKRQHLIGIGIGDKGQHILQDYQQRTGKTAVAIEQNATHKNLENLRREGHTIIVGDATQASSLQHANARHAATLICFIDDEQTGIQVASQLTSLKVAPTSQQQPMRCFVHLHNPRLVTLFTRYSQTTPHADDTDSVGIDIRFFNLFDMLARRFFYQLPLDLAGALGRSDARIHLLWWGFDEVTETLLLQGLRIFHLLPQQSSRWQIVCPNAEKVALNFEHKYPKLARLCEATGIQAVDFVEQTGDYRTQIEAIAARHVDSNEYSVVICACQQDQQNLKHAVELLHASNDCYPALDFPIYVLNHESHDITRLLAGQVRSRLRFFGDLDDFCNYELITAETQDTLAKAIHEDYLRLVGQIPTSSESGTYQARWQTLPEDAKDANRAQADHIIYKLVLTQQYLPLHSESSAKSPVQFTDAQVEALAQAEHQRWAAHRYLRGWDFGDVRDDARKLHPSLVAWEHLSESERQKDRDTVLRLPHLLQQVQDIAL